MNKNNDLDLLKFKDFSKNSDKYKKVIRVLIDNSEKGVNLNEFSRKYGIHKETALKVLKEMEKANEIEKYSKNKSKEDPRKIFYKIKPEKKDLYIKDYNRIYDSDYNKDFKKKEKKMYEAFNKKVKRYYKKLVE